ncbi:hypothetical protein AMATHDRAFT_43577 [Amanita thiersii Skay4041]|uniref:Uncharacterized protein n=1 Tax=Amanita thiersii Skay4041 TaxID=703135 RepID=A0A2A9NDZ2_9AGAR|nr:hypothetical protein AMATHDRAFT_43577 [Amanita thiersii Skay4041]
MLLPTIPTGISHSCEHTILLNHHNLHSYYKQPYPLQVIQLVEAPPPPSPRISSVVHSSSAPSSQYSDSIDDSDSSHIHHPEDDDEEVCSSYCSSDLPPEQLESPSSRPESLPSSQLASDPSDWRMKRILAWRENFSAAMTASLSDTLLSGCLKRKFDHRQDDDDDNDDTISHTSKRSRSDNASISSLGEHSCPACDATFPSRQSLRQHGLDTARSNEACSVAVEYAFE